MNVEGTCRYARCPRMICCKGLCRKHYMQERYVAKKKAAQIQLDAVGPAL